MASARRVGDLGVIWVAARVGACCPEPVAEGGQGALELSKSDIQALSASSMVPAGCNAVHPLMTVGRGGVSPARVALRPQLLRR